MTYQEDLYCSIIEGTTNYGQTQIVTYEATGYGEIMEIGPFHKKVIGTY